MIAKSDEMPFQTGKVLYRGVSLLKDFDKDVRVSLGYSNSRLRHDCGGMMMKYGIFSIGAFAVAAVMTVASSGYASEEPAFLEIRNLSADGFLNMREEPVLTAQKVGTVPASIQQVRNLGCQVGMPLKDWRKASSKVRRVEMKRRWCKIEHDGLTGWAAGDFLSE